MDNTGYIFFDCMETIVDMAKLPNLRDYAMWGFAGSGMEELWEDFDEYFRYYTLARADMAANLPDNHEYEMYDRFIRVVLLSFPEMDFVKVEDTARRISENYWRNYKALSFVREDVLESLPALARQCRLGVVSNFMVMGGIEEMLEIHGVKKYFDFVVTSVAEGWRKPHPAIYEKAVSLSGVSGNKIIFVGDDYINDFITPGKLGMRSIYLDRYGRHPEIAERVADFYQLRDMLLSATH